MAVGPEWVRVGDLLKARRTELARTVDPDWRYRKRFVVANQLDARTTSDIEEGRRDNYTKISLQRIERAYRWRLGSIARALDGGDPTPIPIELGQAAGAGGELLAIQQIQIGEELQQTLAAAADALNRMSEEERAAAEQEMVRLMREALHRHGAKI